MSKKANEKAGNTVNYSSQLGLCVCVFVLDRTCFVAGLEE